ncbi:MAG: CotH kinase family protein [Flavobacteriales bacterium]|nr:CotH kinase family protein [Flavobacteriales bacterium]
MMKLLFATALLILSSMHLLAQELVLSEYGPTSGFNDHSAWFEVQNRSEEGINLSELELYLNDDLIYTGPDSLLGVGGFFVFHADGYRSSRKPQLAHRSMFSPTRGSYILHFNNTSSSLKEQCVPEGMSYGLNENNNEVHFRMASRGEENGGEEVLFLPNDPLPSLASGFYPNPISVTFEQQEWEGQKTVYSLNGVSLQSSNTEASSKGISITNQSFADLSYIPASGEHIEPNGNVQTAQTIHAQSFQYTCAVSKVVREVYFIGEALSNKYKLPVITITTEDEALFGARGIYGYGESGHNFDMKGELWERDASLHFFDDGELKLSQDVGLRIRGKSSRWAPQKSFKIYARSVYGRNQLPNVFFDDEVDFLKRINLRSAHNDYIRSMMTDHVAMTSAKEQNFDTPNSKHAILFLNGEFWGVYAIQDSMDEHYPDSYYGVDDDNVELVDGSESSTLNYTEIINYAVAHPNMTDEDVAWIEDRVDLPSLLEYHAFQIYMANWDWPQKNVKAWLSEAENQDLRYFFFDCDACFNEYENESLGRFYPELNTSRHSILLSSLLRNEEVRKQFSNTLVTLLQGPLKTSTLLSIIDETEQNIQPHIDEHIARWGYPQNRSTWENSVESMRLFAIKRPQKIQDMVSLLLGDKIGVYPNPVQAWSTLNLISFGLLTDEFSFEIFNLSGMKLQEGISNNEQVPLNELSPGNYILKINKGGFNAYTRFVVMP